MRLIGQFFPPELSFHYLKAALVPLEETLAMAAGGILLAIILGMIAALWVGAGLPGSKAAYSALAAIRSFPDLTLAILCVVVIGIGPAAGMLAIAVFEGPATLAVEERLGGCEIVVGDGEEGLRARPARRNLRVGSKAIDDLLGGGM